MTIVKERPAITGGVDTHSEVHVAAALDPVGGLLGTQEFPATAAGYARLLGWLGKFGDVGPVHDTIVYPVAAAAALSRSRVNSPAGTLCRSSRRRASTSPAVAPTAIANAAPAESCTATLPGTVRPFAAARSAACRTSWRPMPVRRAAGCTTGMRNAFLVLQVRQVQPVPGERLARRLARHVPDFAGVALPSARQPDAEYRQ